MSPQKPQDEGGAGGPDPEILTRALPSGRTLVLSAGRAGEEIVFRSAGGDVDLRITLTDAGPVISMRGARVEVDAPDVAFRCHDFAVQANEVRVEAKEDIHLNGAFIRLNCTAEGEAEAQALLSQLAAGTVGLPPAEPHDCAAHAGHAAPAVGDPEPGAP
jgi:hypothetical protein